MRTGNTSGHHGKSRERRQQSKRGGDEPSNSQAPAKGTELSGQLEWQGKWPQWTVVAVAVLTTFLWAYWPTLVRLVDQWNRQPDYSHGYLVVPLALIFLYARRETFPGFGNRLAWPGLVLILMSVIIRLFGARYYIDAIDGWSIPFWVAGVIWLLGGWRVLYWSLPSVLFLWFMIPLPWNSERWLSLPLQRIATKLSCWGLQFLGLPALSEGNTIHINEYQLEVEQACSGLRIFVGVVALAFVYLVLVRRLWWERVLLMVSVVPIALIANATRIITTGVLYQYVSGEAAYKWTHDFSGYVMIPFAAALFALVLWYLRRLVLEVEPVGVESVVRRESL